MYYSLFSNGPRELSNWPAVYVTYQWKAVRFVASANPLCLSTDRSLPPKLRVQNFPGPTDRQVMILLYYWDKWYR